MAKQRHLKNAPIREGLIDIQFEPPVPMERLQAFVDSVKNRFAETSTLWQQALGFELKVGAAAAVIPPQAATAVGFRFQDARHVLMIRVNGFTFSRLPPYADWDELSAGAKAFWEQFVDIVRPETVNRLAVRYINVLPLPIKGEDFSVYLTAAPIVPGHLPQGLASFLQRVVMVDPDRNCQAIVTQAIEESQPTDGRVQLFLDIDAFQVRRFDGRDSALWSSLDSLRDFKNDIFFAHITEPTAEIFE